MFLEIEDEIDVEALAAALHDHSEDDRESARAQSVADEDVADFLGYECDGLDEERAMLRRERRWAVADWIMRWASLDMYDPHVGMPAVDVGHVHSAILEHCRGRGIAL